VEFGPIFGHFKRNTQILGLIRLEFAVQERKIGGTTPMLALPLNPDKPKVVRPSARRDAGNAALLKN